MISNEIKINFNDFMSKTVDFEIARTAENWSQEYKGNLSVVFDQGIGYIAGFLKAEKLVLEKLINDEAFIDVASNEAMDYIKGLIKQL